MEAARARRSPPTARSARFSRGYRLTFMFRSFACFYDSYVAACCIVGGTCPLVLQAVEHGSNEGMARMLLEGGKGWFA